MTTKHRKPDLQDDSDDRKIETELVNMNLKFSRHLGMNMDAENIAVIRAHATEAKGQTPMNKHWRLSTLEFTVDDSGEIVGYSCEKD